jgi:Protein of unknown function (DUF3592)
MGFLFGSQGPSYQALTTLLRSRITYFLMIGLGLLLGAWFVMEDQYLRDAPTAFRKTACVVTDVDVRAISHNRRGFATSFAPVISFTYQADGRERQGKGYRLYEGGMSEDEADDVAEQYDPGQQTYCYYDPANPDRAVLSLEGDQRSLGLCVALSILLLVGGLAGWIVLEYVVKPAEAKPSRSLEEIEEALGQGRRVGAVPLSTAVQPNRFG